MTKEIIKIFSRPLIIIFLLVPITTFARGEVVINEIAWMGQKDSYSKEWIELYNTTNKEINLINWKLKISKIEVPLKGIIAANSYFLLERNSDNTVTELKADIIFKKAFNNKGEIIILSDRKGQEIDKIDCSSGWFSGDNKTKQTMEKIIPLEDGNNKTNWQNSENENGTPKEKNSIGTKKEPAKTEIDSTLGVANNNTDVIENSSSQLPIPAETYFVAGITAILSAGSILVIKKLSV
ncbi:MAG: lamin tail domain-containing protein [Candidatus Paceibacterota bacterium]|jgi:hypothetical protein